MLLCSLDVDLTLCQVHRPGDLGDEVGSLVEEDGHSGGGTETIVYERVNDRRRIQAEQRIPGLYQGRGNEVVMIRRRESSVGEGVPWVMQAR